MKKQILFLFDDIKNTFFHFCINLLQLTAGLVLFCYVLTTWFEFVEIKDKMKLVTENSEVYMFRDDTSDKKFDKIINDNASLERLGVLYDKIISKVKNSNEGTELYLADSSMEFCFKEGIKVSKKVAKYDSHVGGYSSQLLSITPNFLKVFHLDGTYDSYNVLSEFAYKEGQDVPVILGADFAEFYNINDTLQDCNGQTYKVIGFLQSNSNYVAPDESKELLSLDKFIITPCMIDRKDSISIVRFVQNLYVMTNDKEIAEGLADFSRQQDLLDLSVINFSYQLSHIISDTEDEIFINSTFLIIILIFAFVGITGNLLQFITNNKKEFAINLLCGAKKADVIFRILMQIILMVVIGLGVTIVVFGVTAEFFITVIFAILFISAVILYPISILKHQSITTMIRRSYE